MNDRRDLELVLESGTPLIVIETTDEARVLELLQRDRPLALRELLPAAVPLVRHGRYPAARSRSRGPTPQRRSRGSASSHPRRRQTRHVRVTGFSSVPEGAGPHPLAQRHRTSGERARVPCCWSGIGSRSHTSSGFTARFAMRLPDRERSARDRRALRGGVSDATTAARSKWTHSARAAGPEL